jgi:hypothetical protein
LIVVGGELSPLGAVFLILQALAGIWLSLHFLTRGSSDVLRSNSPARKTLVVGTGVLGVLSALLNWYGYASHKVRYLSYGLDALNTARWSLYAVLVALLIYIVVSSKRSPGENTSSRPLGR